MGEGTGKGVRRNNKKHVTCLVKERGDSMGNNIIMIMHYHSYA